MKKSILDQFASDAINAPAAITGGGCKKKSGSKSKRSHSKSKKSHSKSKKSHKGSGSSGGCCCSCAPKC